MIIIQFQITDTDGDELQLVPDFCKWLQNNILNNYINNYNLETKIKARLNHLQEVSWIKWRNNKKHKLNSEQIINTIINSIKIKKYKDNIFKIETDIDLVIPNTHTSIDRLIRFLNSGDNETPATDFITQIQHKLNYVQLNSMWKLYITNELGYFTDSRLVTQVR